MSVFKHLQDMTGLLPREQTRNRRGLDGDKRPDSEREEEQLQINIQCMLYLLGGSTPAMLDLILCLWIRVIADLGWNFKKEEVSQFVNEIFGNMYFGVGPSDTWPSRKGDHTLTYTQAMQATNFSKPSKYWTYRELEVCNWKEREVNDCRADMARYTIYQLLKFYRTPKSTQQLRK